MPSAMSDLLQIITATLAMAELVFVIYGALTRWYRADDLDLTKLVELAMARPIIWTSSRTFGCKNFSKPEQIVPELFVVKILFVGIFLHG